MSDHFRVIVGVPSGSTWEAQFGVDLVNLVASFTKKPVPGYRSQELRVVNVRSSILPKNRLDLVKAAQKMKASHLLFLDTDQTFPPDLVHRLAEHGKLIVAANIATKQIPANTTARQKAADPKGTPVFTDAASAGLEQVWRVGTGVMLINMAVFDEIGLNVWHMPWIEGADTYQGEDWTFCAACENAGFSIWVDHTISKEVGHLGNYEYTHDVVGNWGSSPPPEY